MSDSLDGGQLVSRLVIYILVGRRWGTGRCVAASMCRAGRYTASSR